MNGYWMKSRIKWMWLCSAAAMIATPFVSCSGPVPQGTSSITGGTGAGAGGAGSGSTIPLTTSAYTGTTTSSQVSDVDGGNCGVQAGNLTKSPADLLLILDRSGSMGRAMNSSSNCNAGSTTCQQRWATMISGLNAVFASSSGNVNWGLKLYASDGTCGVNAAMEVPVSAAGAATIQTRIAQVSPGSNTPTRAAVNAGVAYLKTVTGPESKNILLATDGEPNCNGGNTTSDVPGTVTAITAAAAAGFKVYVLGVGPEAGNLDNFAAAGGTGKYFPALSPQALTDALGAIVGAVATCSFTLPKAPPDPSNVAVEFDGNSTLRAPRDTSHTNGWDYTSTTSIQLYGSWCDNITNGTYKSVKILMGCPGQIIP